ncbi:fucose-binding protein [Roseomonas aerophila]|uniref:Fucose-binding protein n=1 Tax=Teichococcus aerophilus TaxID=1224513 RepID=A0ABR7RQD8_9PROT|nr:RbsD/FucU domain-containing protein [Pseudoroseomonas aerophila]MBC9208561.1 fucose-binding protein [Pseudoroseomonas aerophila]
MLKHIDPLLTPDLLWVLAAMGHGDDLALVDANFPAEAVARATSSGRLLRLPGLRMGAVARAILSVLPLDDFVPDPVRCMQVVGDPTSVPPVQQEMRDIIRHAAGPGAALHGLERFAFYEASRQAFAVVQVGDARSYGDFLFRKGAIAGL